MHRRHRHLPAEREALNAKAAGPTLSEEARALFDRAACGLLQTTGDGTILRANERFCSWLGVVESELAGHRRLSDLLTIGARIFHYTHWLPLLKMQGAIAEVKLELMHRDGTVVPMVLNAIRREENGGEVHDVACFVVRDRDLYERELVKARQRLEELVKEASDAQAKAVDRALLAEQMIGIVSHDLRNPLSSISMAAVLLEQDALTESQQRSVGRITRSAERAKGLISDLLDFTQARLGKRLSTSVAPVGLHEAIADCVDELATIYAGRKLVHVQHGAGGCHADRNRIEQLVGNLVSNAMAYGKNDGVVTVTSSIEDNGFFTIAVHNEGQPIPEDIRAHLFEPMTRGPSTANPGRSIGLGLFIVQEIVKAHGGSVDVTSTPEAGTTFRARFPFM